MDPICVLYIVFSCDLIFLWGGNPLSFDVDELYFMFNYITLYLGSCLLFECIRCELHLRNGMEL